jgi:hypothetical protein
MLERVTVNPESFMPRASTVPMIQGNPFMTGFNAETQRADQAEERDLRIENARETAEVARTDRANKSAFNQGLGSVLSIQDPAQRASATAQLQARTGQGKDALATLGTEDTRRKSLEDKALLAYSTGQVALGDQYASQAGVVIPEAIKNDGAMAGGLKMARDAGYDDPQQAATFAVNYKQTRDVKAATDAAGPPKPKAFAPPRRELVNIPLPDGSIGIYSHNPADGSIVDTGRRGMATKPGSGTAAGNSRMADYEHRRQIWLAIPGKEHDQEGAALYAAGKKQMSWPEARAAAGVTVRNLRGPYGPMYETEAEVAAGIEKFAHQYMAGPPPDSNLSTVTPGATPTPKVQSATPADPGQITTEQLIEMLRQNGGAP